MTRDLWIGALLAISMAGSAEADGIRYGALAYESQGAYGWSNDNSSADAARSSAKAECEKYSAGRACEVIATFRNRCAALADTRDRDGHVGWAARGALDDAQEAALESCNAKAGEYNCGIIAWTCPTP